MPDHVLTQVEDRLVTVLDGYAALSTYTVTVAESLDVAIETVPALIVTTVDYDFEIGDENWTTLHTAEIHVEAVQGLPVSGTINRANRNALAHVLAAIAADRSLGIGLQDVQENDLAPAEPRHKDMDSASLILTVTWFTARGDWFTIT